MDAYREEELEDKVQHWKRLAIIFAFCLAGMIVFVIVLGTMKNEFEAQVKELTAALESVKQPITINDQIASIDELGFDGWTVELQYDGTYQIHIKNGDISVYLSGIKDRDDIYNKVMELKKTSQITGSN